MLTLPTQILTSSRYLGLLPSEIGSLRLVDWIPVDVAAAVMVDLAGLPTESSGLKPHRDALPSVYHVSSPGSITWKALAPVVMKRLGESVRVVAWGEWMEALRQSGRNAGTQGVLQNPALKLLDFLEALGQREEWPELSVERALEKSPSMARLEPKYVDWMNTWMDQWGFQV